MLGATLRAAPTSPPCRSRPRRRARRRRRHVAAARAGRRAGRVGGRRAAVVAPARAERARRAPRRRGSADRAAHAVPRRQPAGRPCRPARARVQSLQVLDLGRNQLGPELPAPLARLAALRSLDLSAQPAGRHAGVARSRPSRGRRCGQDVEQRARRARRRGRRRPRRARDAARRAQRARRAARDGSARSARACLCAHNNAFRAPPAGRHRRLHGARGLLLDSNRLTTLPAGLSALCALHHLSLDANPLESLPDDFAALAAARAGGGKAPGRGAAEGAAAEGAADAELILEVDEAQAMAHTATLRQFEQTVAWKAPAAGWPRPPAPEFSAAALRAAPDEARTRPRRTRTRPLPTRLPRGSPSSPSSRCARCASSEPAGALERTEAGHAGVERNVPRTLPEGPASGAGAASRRAPPSDCIGRALDPVRSRSRARGGSCPETTEPERARLACRRTARTSSRMRTRARGERRRRRRSASCTARLHSGQ